MVGPSSSSHQYPTQLQQNEVAFDASLRNPYHGTMLVCLPSFWQSFSHWVTSKIPWDLTFWVFSFSQPPRPTWWVVSWTGKILLTMMVLLPPFWVVALWVVISQIVLLTLNPRFPFLAWVVPFSFSCLYYDTDSYLRIVPLICRRWIVFAFSGFPARLVASYNNHIEESNDSWLVVGWNQE